jgi:hypothetical protein
MRTLVITPCDGEVPALAASFPNSEVSACRLVDACSGAHHWLVREGVEAVWQRWGREVLDWVILSGVHGLLHAYEVVMVDGSQEGTSPAGEGAHWGGGPTIHEQAAALVGEYDLAFYLLSGPQLAALNLPLRWSESVQQIVLTDEESLFLVPSLPNLHPFVADGWKAARRWHVKTPQVRGFLFQRLCKRVVRHGPALLEWLCHDPGDTERMFYKRTRWRPQYMLWQSEP